MQSALRLVVLAACFGWAACAGAAAGPDVDALLQEADRIRTSEPVRFKQLLAELQPLEAGASRRQREHAGFLRAYEKARSGALDAAVAEFSRLRRVAMDDGLRFRSGAMLVNVLAVRREFEQGLAVAQDLLQQAGAVGDLETRHHGLLAVAVLYNQVGEHDLGARYAERVVDEGASPRNRCIADNLRVEALMLRAAPFGDGVGRNALAACEAIGDATLAGFSRVYLARKWQREGRIDDALALLEPALAGIEGTGYARLVADVHALLAELKLRNGDDDAAGAHAMTAIGRSDGLGHSHAVVVAYRTLYRLAEAAGDESRALHFHKRYAEADRGHREDVAARAMAYQIVRHQSLRQDQQIELLNRQNEVLQLQQQVQEQSAQNARLLAALLVVLLATIGFWAYKTKRLQVSQRRMAQTDALTGIANRHHFSEQVEKALQQSQRTGQEAALVMFDLDHFKSINDRFGHAVGDWVLQRVARACSGACGPGDVFGRLGGEEFAILVNACDLQCARRLADACRARLAAIDTIECGHRFDVTASFGVTTSALSGYDLARLLSHADGVMYAAKHGGRDRVSVYAAAARAEAGDGDRADTRPAGPVVPARPAGNDPVAPIVDAVVPPRVLAGVDAG